MRGFGLVELVVAMGIVAFVMMMAVPSFKSWTQNLQIRSDAEAIQNGLQYARAEALRRNTTVRFQLMTTADNNCAISTGQASWVVNLGTQTTNDPTGLCATAMPATVSQYVAADAPYILQKSSATTTPNVSVQSNGTPGNWMLVFGSLGQVVWPTNGPTQWDLSNPAAGACATSSAAGVTCMRINVSQNGRIRMCNPAQAAGSPQGC
jgi:type IV fimbrial biogenesis protein FimT